LTCSGYHDTASLRPTETRESGDDEDIAAAFDPFYEEKTQNKARYLALALLNSGGCDYSSGEISPSATLGLRSRPLAAPAAVAAADKHPEPCVRDKSVDLWGGGRVGGGRVVVVVVGWGWGWGSGLSSLHVVGDGSPLREAFEALVRVVEEHPVLGLVRLRDVGCYDNDKNNRKETRKVIRRY